MAIDVNDFELIGGLAAEKISSDLAKNYGLDFSDFDKKLYDEFMASISDIVVEILHDANN